VRVLVTGAGGFIGSHLARRLVRDGHEVHALTSAVSAVYPARLLDLRPDLRLHAASLTDRGALDGVVAASRPEVVFHLGAYTHVGKSWSRVEECVATNVGGTVHLLQALAAAGWPASRVVYTSTSEVYGTVAVPFREDGPVHPVSPYSVSKYAGERFVRMLHEGHGWPLVVVRPFNAFGPAQTPDRVIPEIIGRGLRRERLPMTQGRQTREFTYVEDLVDGFVRAGTTPGIDGEVINLGSGRELSMRDLAELVLRLMGDPVRPEFGALPERPTEIVRMVSDASKARRLLGWAPAIGLEAGLERTIAWYADELASGRPSSFAP